MQANSDKNLEFIEKYILPNIGLNDVDGLPAIIKQKLDSGEPQWSFSITDNIRGKNVQGEYIFSKSETNADDPNSYLSAVKGRIIANDGTMEHEQEFRVVNQRFVNMEKMLGLMNGNAVSFDYFKKGERSPSQGYLMVDAEGALKLYANSTTNFNLARAMSAIPLHKISQQQKEKMTYDINHGFPPIGDVKMPDASIQKAKLELHPKIGALLAKDLDGNRLFFKESMKVISEVPKLSPIPNNGIKKDDKELSAKALALLNKAEEKKNSQKNSQERKTSIK